MLEYITIHQFIEPERQEGERRLFFYYKRQFCPAELGIDAGITSPWQKGTPPYKPDETDEQIMQEIEKRWGIMQKKNRKCFYSFAFRNKIENKNIINSQEDAIQEYYQTDYEQETDILGYMRGILRNEPFMVQTDQITIGQDTTPYELIVFLAE